MNFIIIHSKTTKRLWISLVIGMLCLLLSGCQEITISTNTGNTTDANTTTSNTNTDGGASTSAQNVKLFIEPQAGESVITSAITDAKKSVWVEMYLLTDKKVISALEDAASHHIDVRVMLEAHPYGFGSVSPTETLDKLQAAGIQTKTTNPAFALTHEKGMVIDGTTAYIMTSNFTLSALGAGTSTLNREYGIIDTNAQDVQNVKDIFTDDWNRTQAKVTSSNLVVSPINSRNTFINLIKASKSSLLIEAEEMDDPAVEQALIAQEKQGVKVEVILPDDGSNNAGISTIEKGHVQVKEDGQLYMHAKIIIVDQQKAFVGSENISTSSFDNNRELGIVVSDTSALNSLQQTFQQDWTASNAA
jgi:phosphatidylserine/phosphatidylglycerophosphate/cardiolipin synthase-like enzyme